MIKRYAEVPNSNGLGYSNGLAEDESGAWVSLDDYEALEAKNRELALQILATDGQAQEALARAEAAEEKIAEAVEALENTSGYLEGMIEDGCPKCGGDCSAANPPVTFCPMKETAGDLAKARAALAAIMGNAQ